MKKSQLAIFREETKISRKELAQVIGVSESYLEKIEYGVRNPSFNFISKFTEKYPNADIKRIFFKKV